MNWKFWKKEPTDEEPSQASTAISQQPNLLAQHQYNSSQFIQTPQRYYYVGNQSYWVSSEDYDFLIKKGHEALEKRKQYKDDFKNLLK